MLKRRECCGHGAIRESSYGDIIPIHGIGYVRPSGHGIKTNRILTLMRALFLLGFCYVSVTCGVHQAVITW